MNNDENNTFVEISSNDGIETSNFLEIDDNICENTNICLYKEQSIIILLFSNELSLPIASA